MAELAANMKVKVDIPDMDKLVSEVSDAIAKGKNEEPMDVAREIVAQIVEAFGKTIPQVDFRIIYLQTLEQRAAWLTERIKAKKVVGWDIEWDTKERDSLLWALEFLQNEFQIPQKGKE